MRTAHDSLLASCSVGLFYGILVRGPSFVSVPFVLYTDPETFINMLPFNGNMAFYLPFIEKSYRYNCARMLSKHVVANASDL